MYLIYDISPVLQFACVYHISFYLACLCICNPNYNIWFSYYFDLLVLSLISEKESFRSTTELLKTRTLKKTSISKLFLSQEHNGYLVIVYFIYSFLHVLRFFKQSLCKICNPIFPIYLYLWGISPRTNIVVYRIVLRNSVYNMSFTIHQHL